MTYVYRCVTFENNFETARLTHVIIQMLIIQFTFPITVYGAYNCLHPFRMGRFSKGPVPKASKRQCGSSKTWVRRGPYSARRLKALKASHVWAASSARAQARRPTGDVLGGLPSEKPRGLRGGPAQRQRTQVGRIWSCCQGWKRLDDCCK